MSSRRSCVPGIANAGRLCWWGLGRLSTLLTKYDRLFEEIWYNGAMKKQHLTLTDDDRRDLETLLSKDSLKALTFKRATALLLLDRGKTLVAVAATLAVTSRAVASLRT